MPTTLTNGIQLPDKGSVDWYSSMQSNYNLIDTHLGNTDTHVTAEDKANWNSKQGSLSQAQLDAIAQVATNTDDIASLQSGKANASHTHSSSDITDIGDYATKQYVDTSISDLVDNAPDALNTLNELSAALNDDSNFASTVTTALADKANSSDLATVATSGSYDDLTDTPTIPTNTSDLTNDSNFVVSSSLATVATSGDYDDLSNKPSIPINTSDLNNDSGFVTLNDFDIPAKTSDLTNDSGFITSSDVPTSTSDLINDSNFVDTSNSAVASGITSAKVTAYDSHIADTDIHVTTADKTKWNNGVSQSYVFRYSSTALVASSTNSNTLLDNTDNLKVGDKVIDSSGVLFSITAIDTANSTFTIGSALVDLALDANVVHTSGDETVGGQKTFSSDITLQGTTTPVIKTISNIIQDSTGGNGSISWVIRDKTDSNTIFSQTFNKFSGRSVDWRLEATSIFNGTSTTMGINLVVDPVNESYRFTSKGNNTLDLGSSGKRWKGVYAINYYYGDNNVEFSTKFVTTDTAQTISGIKTFEGVDLKLKSVSGEYTVSSGSASLLFYDKNSLLLSQYKQGVYGSGISYQTFNILGYDSNNQQVSQSITFSSGNLGLSTAFVRANTNNVISLGDSTHRWSDVETNKVNNLEPSSLSLPSYTGNRIDISSYITNLTGGSNNYTVPANGYIFVRTTNGTYVKLTEYPSGVCSSVCSQTADDIGTFLPVNANRICIIAIKCSSIDRAYFIPCQGNV